MLAVTGLAALLLVPAPAQSRVDDRALRCLNNQRQLMRAWQLYATDYHDQVVASGNAPSGRPNWMTGSLDFMAANPSNYQTNQDLIKSPLWPYTAGQAGIFHCPADRSYVTKAGQPYPRIRSLSMSAVFGSGEWLNGSIGSPAPYLTYAVLSDVRLPAHTFVFIDEHPDSINDGQLAVSCVGAQPGDAPGQAKIIDIPAAYHNGGVGLSFADGHAEIHNWIGSMLRSQPIVYSQGGLLPLNISAGDSWVDMHWLAANTTVKQ
ncbi:MAG TPA: hypothetical protein VL527_11020 [Dongiaceae bacterium]|nr:hypothetical protein [Dongiaceae bacterium]